MALNSIITGTGSCIPTEIKKNSDFLTTKFLNEDGSIMEYENEVVIEKFKAITGIEERRYAAADLTSSDLAYISAKKAIEDAGLDQEELDYIIVAHNFGDVKTSTIQSDILPSLASRVKHKLGIKNPNCVAYDILFGCPGWIQGVIQAEAYIKSGIAKKCLVIGTETLSRVLDPNDRDSMIYSDGAGACVIEAVESETPTGILSHAAQTFPDTRKVCGILHFIYLTMPPRTCTHRTLHHVSHLTDISTHTYTYAYRYKIHIYTYISLS